MTQQCITGEMSYPFAATPNNSMTETAWAAMMGNLLGTGVIISGPVVTQPGCPTCSTTTTTPTTLKTLGVTAGTGLTVKVDTGQAWVYGHYYQNSVIQTLQIPANDNSDGTRADLIVLDLKWGVDGGIHLAILPGVPGAQWPAGNGAYSGQPMPAAPIITQGVEWQLPLAQVNIRWHSGTIAAGDIMDWRYYVKCGTAKSATTVVCSSNSSPCCQACADACVAVTSPNGQDVINAALDNMQLTYGGGTLQLSEGTYNCNNSIVVPSNCNLQGMGSNTLINFVGGDLPAIVVNNQTNVNISNFSLYGGGAFTPLTPQNPNLLGDGIKVTNGIRVVLKNITINGAKKYGINIVSNSPPSTSYGHLIKDCQVTGCYAGGLKFTGNSGQVSNNQFTGNLIGMAVDGYAIDGGAFQNTFNGNLINYNSEQGIIVGNDGYLVQSCIFSGNILSENCIQNDVTYDVFDLLGAYSIRNFITGNLLATTVGATSFPLYGIYLDTFCGANTITNNDCSTVAKPANAVTNNIFIAGTNIVTNTSPNWIRFNRSGCLAPDGSSLDA